MQPTTYILNERKGIRLQFRSLLGIRLPGRAHRKRWRPRNHGNMNPFLREANKRHRKSFLFCFTVTLAVEVFHREIRLDRLVEHGIKLLCRCSLLGP